MADVVMPRLSDTMEEGTILRWLIADGQRVKRGDELVEIETDKANMTYEADLDGVLEVVAAEGDTLPVGATIARVGEPAGDAPAAETERAAAPAAAGAEAGQAESQPRPGAEATTSPPEPGAPVRTGRVEPQPAEANSPETGGADGARVKASPLARRVAHERGVDLHGLTGSGPGGRIVKADVEQGATGAVAGDADLGATGAAPPPAGGLADVTRAKGETTEVELTRTQQTIARRMAESKATIPHFALRAEIDMRACAELRGELKRLAPSGRAAESGAGRKPSSRETAPKETVPTYNDMVVKACALALREHKRANASYRDGRLQLHGRVNVGVAVAVEPEGGNGNGGAAGGGTLVVPTVFDADQKSLGEIARETRALAERTRDGTITPPELGGGTFTVSNLGMFGVDEFTAIVNPPQAAILAVGVVKPRAVVSEDGEIVARETMTVTLACDHRILYGADAAGFLARIRELLEQPASLTL
jgi:pyruvate dehydrogenase E2 component (dihydrolipoamide acetyltransferase)